MIRYFCNRCSKEVNENKTTITVWPDADLSVDYHFCADCYKVVSEVLNEKLVDKLKEIDKGPQEYYANLAEEPRAMQVPDEKDDIPVVAQDPVPDKNDAAVTETSKDTDNSNAEPNKEEVNTESGSGIGRSDNQPVQEPKKVEEPEDSKKPAEEPKETTVRQTETSVKEAGTAIKKSDDEQPKRVGRPKAVAKVPVAQPKRTIPSTETEQFSSKVTLSNELPKPPTKRANLDRARRVLIDYYQGVAPKTTQGRNRMAAGDYYYILKRYGSQPIKDRYSEGKEWTENGKAIKPLQLLSLYAGGFTMQRIADEELYIDIMTVQEIIHYYTGL